MEPWAEVDVLKAQWIVADEPQPADDDEIRRFTGEDYPELCGRCRAAIDAGWLMLIECELWDGRFYCDDDPEAGLMYAGDEKWLCGGHECACRQEEEEPAEDGIERVCWLTAEVTRYAWGWEVVEYGTYTLPVTGEWHDLSQLAVEVGQALDRQATANWEGVTAVIDYGREWAEINIDIMSGSREMYAMLLEGEKDHVGVS